MADQTMDFYQRVNRIQKAYKKGRGFEAPGTRGRSYYKRRALRVRLPMIIPMVTVFAGVMLLKALILNTIGAATYDYKVQQLQAGVGIEPMGAFVMQADPLTLWVAGRIANIRL